MHISKGLVIGILGALALGGVEVLAQDAMTSDRTSAAGVHEVTVPVGHIGDRVVFQRSQQLPPGMVDEFDGWTREWGFDGFQVDAVADHVDSTGKMHRVVWVAYSMFDQWSGGVAQREWSTSATVTAGEAYDLSSRDLIAGRVDQEADRKFLFAQQSHDERGFVGYGPLGEQVVDERDPDVRYRSIALYHQGRTYRLGESLPDYANSLLAGDEGLISMWGSVDVFDVDARAFVAQAGYVESRAALDLRMEGCLRLEVTPPPYNFWVWKPNEIRVFGFPAPLPARFCFTIDQWVTGDIPYPVLTQIKLVVNQTTTMNMSVAVSSYEPGSDPIPWQPVRAGVYLTEQPGLEHTPSGHVVPADGEGLAWVFPPSAAIRAVESDPGLAAFAQWRSEHPDSFLAGLMLWPSGPSGTGRVWSLTFAQPDGQAFVVNSEKVTSPAPATQTQIGPVSSPPFAKELFPDAPITFAEAQRLRARHGAAPESSREPNVIGWGLAARVAGINCAEVQQCGPNMAEATTRFSPDSMDIGYADAYQASGAADVQAGAPRDLRDHITLGTAHGQIFRSLEKHRETTIEPLAPITNFEPPEPRPQTAEPIVRTDLGAAAAVSSSLLALFLFAYFLPAIKFAATRFAFFLPGYAKTEPSELLQNKVRETIMSAIRADPGITPPELQRLTRVAWSTVVYHLQLLQKKKLVSSLLDGRHRRFFPVEGFRWNTRDRVAALKNLRTRALYELILQEPGVGPGALADRVGLTRPAVYWHIDRLTKVGLVGRDRIRLRTALFANPAAEDPRHGMEIA